MNKPDLIHTLKNLDALSQEQKSYLIDLVNTKKKYGLVWEDKPEDVEELLRQHLPVLTEVPERRILASLEGGREPFDYAQGDNRKTEERSVASSQATLDFAAPTNGFSSSTL